MGLFEGGADASAAMRTRGLGALACLPDEVSCGSSLYPVLRTCAAEHLCEEHHPMDPRRRCSTSRTGFRKLQ